MCLLPSSEMIHQFQLCSAPDGHASVCCVAASGDAQQSGWLVASKAQRHRTAECADYKPLTQCNGLPEVHRCLVACRQSFNPQLSMQLLAPLNISPSFAVCCCHTLKSSHSAAPRWHLSCRLDLKHHAICDLQPREFNATEQRRHLQLVSGNRSRTLV